MDQDPNPAPNADAPDPGDTLESKPDAVDDAVIKNPAGENETSGDSTRESSGDDEQSGSDED